MFAQALEMIMSDPSARPALPTDGIVDAAMSLIRDDGVDGFSMQRLSEHRGTRSFDRATGLTKNDLLTLCGRRLVGQAYASRRQGDDPLVWVRQQIVRLCNAMGPYPGIATYVAANIETVFPGFVDSVHAALRDAGLNEEDATTARWTLYFFSIAARWDAEARANDPHSVKDRLDAFAEGVDFILAPTRSGQVSERQD